MTKFIKFFLLVFILLIIYILFNYFVNRTQTTTKLSHQKYNNNIDSSSKFSSYKIDDEDLIKSANYNFIHENKINYQYEELVVNKKNYKIGIYYKNPIGNKRYLVLHDNEDIAFDSGVRSISQGGLMIALENNEQRYLYDFASNSLTNIDPNRIFKANDKIFSLSKKILTLLQIQPATFIIALHNNNPNSDFGLKNIKNYGNTEVICHNDLENKNLFWFPYNKTPTLAKLRRENYT